MFVIDNMNMVIESTFECLPVIAVVTQSGKKGSRILPGQREYVKTYKDASLFWHCALLSAGRPTEVSLASLMKSARNKYHLAVKNRKREANRSKSVSLM